MQQIDFLDFEHLKVYCTRHGTPEGVRFSDACWLRVSKKYTVGYELATNYFSLEQEGHKVRVAKGIGKKADETFSLKKKKCLKEKNTQTSYP